MTSRTVFERILPAAEIHVSEPDGERWRSNVWLSGEMDGECAIALDEQLAAQRAARRTLVRIDVNAVSFMDSAVLEVLCAAHGAWLRMRGTLVLLGVTGPTLRVLRLTGQDRVLLHMPPVAVPVLRELASTA